MDHDKLHLLDDRIALADALARAVANQSPAAIEGYRASLVAERRELCGEDTDLAVPDEPGSDPSVSPRSPGSELLASDQAAADANPRMADAEGEDADHEDGPGEQLLKSDLAAQDANPHGVDSRGNVGDNRPELSDEDVRDQAESIRPHDDNEVAAPHVEAPVMVDAPADEDHDQA